MILLTNLRGEDEKELLPALQVTAEPTREVIRRAQQAHVYSVLPKPVNGSMTVLIRLSP